MQNPVHHLTNQSFQLQFNPQKIKRAKNPDYLRKCINNGIKYIPRLLRIILLHRELPPWIIMRMRRHKHLQLLRIPLIPFITHLPPLLPRPSIHIQELYPIVQLLRRHIHLRLQHHSVVLVRHFPSSRLSRGLEREARCAETGPGGFVEVGRDGSRNAVPEDHEEEEDEGDDEPDREEVCEDEVFQG